MAEQESDAVQPAPDPQPTDEGVVTAAAEAAPQGSPHDGRANDAVHHKTHSLQIARIRKCERRKRRLKSWIEPLGALATVFIAILTAVYAYFSFQQWRTMRDQLGQADRNLKLTYRARLHFDTLPLKRPEITSDGLSTWKVNYFNDGRGTATQIWRFALVQTDPSPPRFLRQKGSANVYTLQSQSFPVFPPLASGRTDSMGLEPFIYNHALPSLAQAVVDEKQGLTIQVVLFYTDEFGDAHETSRCITYQDERTSSFCPDGNYDD